MAETIQELEEKVRSMLPKGVDFDAYMAAVEDAWKKAPPDEKEKGRLLWRSQVAHDEDTPDSFAHFFWCCTRIELPPHALFAYIVPIYYAHGDLNEQELADYFARPEASPYLFIFDAIKGRSRKAIGAVIQASRELIKTTVCTIYFAAYRIGKKPWGAGLLIQVGDDIAKDNTSAIARVIAEFDGWKACFPSIIPDREKGWGDKGYEVRDTSKTPEEWNKLNATRKDPTLIGLGYTSHALIGKHPDNFCIVDDIHDETNTASMKELDEVLRIVSEVISYTFTSEAFVCYIGTPWVTGDTLDYIGSTGLYVFVKIPAYMEVVKGKMVYPDEWKEDTVKVYMWEEKRGPDWVAAKLQGARTIQNFYRMVLLNLKSAGEKYYRYQRFPNKDLKRDEWPITVGVDPTGTISGLSGAGISSFAMSHVYETPYATAVIGGGYVKKVTADIGEAVLASFARIHLNFRNASAEYNGVSILFISMAQRNVGLRISAHLVSELGIGSKKNRQFAFLSPLFSNGTLLVSDGEGDNISEDDREYLRTLKNYLDRFPKIDDDAPELDVADSLCMAILDMPRIWMNVHQNIATPASFGNKEKKSSPYDGLSRYSYLNPRG